MSVTGRSRRMGCRSAAFKLYCDALVVAAAGKVGLYRETSVEADDAPGLIELLLEPEFPLDVRYVADGGRKGEARPEQDGVEAQVALRRPDAQKCRMREERVEQNQD